MTLSSFQFFSFLLHIGKKPSKVRHLTDKYDPFHTEKSWWIFFFFFFYIWVSFHDHSRITGLQGKGEGISLTSHYHFHLPYRHLVLGDNQHSPRKVLQFIPLFKFGNIIWQKMKARGHQKYQFSNSLVKSETFGNAA